MSKTYDLFHKGEFKANRVQAELACVCESPALVSSPKLRQMLRFLVGEALAGRADNLKAYTIAVDGMGRSENFCADTDPYIRNLAVRLRRALSDHYANGGRGAELKILLRRGTYAPEFRTNAGEAHTTGHTAEAELPTGGSHTAAKRLEGAPSLLVHTLDEDSGTRGRTSHGSALSEGIVVEMNRFPHVRLFGPFENDEAPLTREGAAQFTLRGRVRAQGKEMHVTLRLLDGRTQECLWAQVYHWPANTADSAQFEELFLRRVAVTLADWDGIIPAIDTLARNREDHDEALTPYDAALKAHGWGATLTDESFLEALRQLEKCVEENAESSIVHAALSDLYFSDYLSGIGYVEDGLEKAETFARDAVKLDPASPEAHWALGQVHFARKKIPEFESEFAKAISLNPNDITIVTSYGLYLAGLGDRARGMEMFTKAKNLSGHAPPWAYVVPWLHHYSDGNYEAARADAESIATPGLLWGDLAQAATFGMMGRKMEAHSAVEALLGKQPHFIEEGSLLLGHLIQSGELLELISEGLHRAGLDLRRKEPVAEVA